MTCATHDRALGLLTGHKETAPHTTHISRTRQTHVSRTRQTHTSDPTADTLQRVVENGLAFLQMYVRYTTLSYVAGLTLTEYLTLTEFEFLSDGR